MQFPSKMHRTIRFAFLLTCCVLYFHCKVATKWNQSKVKNPIYQLQQLSTSHRYALKSSDQMQRKDLSFSLEFLCWTIKSLICLWKSIYTAGLIHQAKVPLAKYFVLCRSQGLVKMMITGQVHSNISSGCAKYHEGLPKAEMVSLHTFMSSMSHGENTLLSMFSQYADNGTCYLT